MIPQLSSAPPITADRKALVKYYPPDFDYRRLDKLERLKDKQDNVRMMLPMSVRCLTCGNFMYIGTKFNMRKETVLDEDYLGIKIYRFYFKCTRCSAEVTMKTDPKNHDYVCEHGASRNYEPWRDMANAEQVLRTRRNLDDGDAMKSLENRTFDSKKEMELIEALDEVRLLNKRQAKIGPDQLLEQFAPTDANPDGLNAEGLSKDDLEQLRVFKRKKLATLDEESEEDEAGSC